MDRHYPQPTGFGNRPTNFSVGMKVHRIKTRAPEPKYLYKESLGGTLMKIKFDRYEMGKTNPNAEGKTYPMIFVHGTALSGANEGQDYMTKFFPSAKDMTAQVKSFTKGDIVDITMKKNGKFWNPTKFEKVVDDGNVGFKPNSDGPPVGNIDVHMPEEHKRLERFKIASKLLKDLPEDAIDTVQQVGAIADMIGDYTKKEGMFQFDKDTEDGIPGPSNDDLGES